MAKTIEQVIYKMLTENTGASIADSGGAYGRNWERNANKTLEDFQNEPEATLEISQWRDGDYSLDATMSVFHKLTKTLDLDDLCQEFNALEVGNWNGEYYGTDQGQCDWLIDNGFEAEGNGFNTYNGESILSQILQGQWFERDGSKYLLLQIHGGCDARAGYTNAKLFTVDDDFMFINEDCGFELPGEVSLDLLGASEWTNREGDYLDNDDINKIAKEAGVGKYTGWIF